MEDNYTTNKLNNLNISYKCTYHYDENTDKHSHKIGEKGQRMFHIVHVAEVCLLYNLLCVDHHVSHKDQQSEVELQQQIRNKMRSLRNIEHFTVGDVWCTSNLKIEAEPPKIEEAN